MVETAAAPKPSLADRIRANKLGTAELIKICVVPGEPRAKTYEILLILPCPGIDERRWIQLLAKLGYAGSTVIATVNFSSVEDIMATGEISAIVNHDGDMFSKDWRMKEAVDRVTAKNIRIAPLYTFTDPLYVEWAEEPLRAFLAEHCPLS
jgi:hypothetical protein